MNEQKGKMVLVLMLPSYENQKNEYERLVVEVKDGEGLVRIVAPQIVLIVVVG